MTKMQNKFYNTPMKHLQVQEWLGNNYLKAEEYGWTLENGEYSPNTGYKDFCPREIMKIISCSCKDCSKRCSCVKFGLQCSDLCKCGEDCANHADECEEVDEESSDHDEEEGL